VVGRLKQDRWTSPEGQARSKIQIVAEHVEFKPQLKKDGDGEEKPEAATAEETAADDQAEKEGELKEAASF
jgi:single-strand DNA-binding protein